MHIFYNHKSIFDKCLSIGQIWEEKHDFVADACFDSEIINYSLNS
jgi:hypothetical protein